MDSIERAVLVDKERGWRWVAEQFAEARERTRREVERLLGPDRGL